MDALQSPTSAAPPKPSSARVHSHTRAAIAGFVLLLLLAAYALAIILGRVPADRRIDTPALGIIVVGCLIALFLLRPELLERITRFEALGWKIEMENRQQQQDAQLKDLQLIIPLLLPPTERRHLINLADNKTADYKGNNDLRTELRRLRSIKLIEMQPEKNVSMMEDGSRFDLARYVRLTKLGEQWAERVKHMEAEAKQEAQAAGNN